MGQPKSQGPQSNPPFPPSPQDHEAKACSGHVPIPPSLRRTYLATGHSLYSRRPVDASFSTPNPLTLLRTAHPLSHVNGGYLACPSALTRHLHLRPCAPDPWGVCSSLLQQRQRPHPQCRTALGCCGSHPRKQQKGTPAWLPPPPPLSKQRLLADSGHRSVGGDLLLNFPLFYGQATTAA